MARSVVGRVLSISSSTGNAPGVLDFVVTFYSSTLVNCISSGTIIAKCDITQNDTQLTNAIRQAIADYINSISSNNVTAADIVGCNV